VDVEGRKPVLHASAIHSILRDNQPEESFSTKTTLLNAPKQRKSNPSPANRGVIVEGLRNFESPQKMN
jgi:hypothetical protein